MRISFDVSDSQWGDLHTATLFAPVEAFILGEGSLVSVEANPEQAGSFFDTDLSMLHFCGAPQESLAAVSALRANACQRFAMFAKRAT